MPTSPSRRPSQALTKLIAAALLDSELRENLFADREATAREFGVPLDEIEALKGLDRHRFEQSADQIRWG
jgi:hypothetical protein